MSHFSWFNVSFDGIGLIVAIAHFALLIEEQKTF